MNITVNGKHREAADSLPLRQLVVEVTGRELTEGGQPADGRRLGVAVAHNSEVVPRGRWAGLEIKDGDDVEIVAAVQGG
ncbi:sulfur carrier protein ThiS [Arthrobacter castelli]|uniref:sulfur carrier protein ThiS n=1 Tax=Arthrobacter castelli TaxID=271431 RepID=UPI00041760CE|nr:sulfur carrier protein ThiS [Arthrobacter castelli]